MKEPVASPAPSGNKPPRPRVRLESLLGQGRELVIIHGTDEYLLRLTRNGKLILTK